MSLLPSRLLRTTFTAIPLLAVGFSCCVWFWRPGTFFKTTNLGHRLGGDIVDTLPENTCEVFRRAVMELESDPDYHFSECDLRETSDHEIVVFHDWDLGRMVPDTEANRQALSIPKIDETIELRDLSLAQIKKLRLAKDCQIPTLGELLQCAADLQLTKPLILEIKFLHSEKARREVIEVTQEFRDRHGMEVHFSSFIRNIKRSCPNPRTWLDQFKAAGFRVYQVYRPKTPANDLCETW